jgi:hypothetical protein
MIDAIVDGLIYVASVPAVLFPAMYASRSNWRATAPGRSLMQLAVALAVVMLLIVATMLFGNDYLFRDWIRFLAYGFLVTSLWRQVFTLARAQNVQQRAVQRARDSVLDDK